jgi:hypothetical protein
VLATGRPALRVVNDARHFFLNNRRPMVVPAIRFTRRRFFAFNFARYRVERLRFFARADVLEYKYMTRSSQKGPPSYPDEPGFATQRPALAPAAIWHCSLVRQSAFRAHAGKHTLAELGSPSSSVQAYPAAHSCALEQLCMQNVRSLANATHSFPDPQMPSGKPGALQSRIVHVPVGARIRASVAEYIKHDP